MSKLEDVRKEIDAIDVEMATLFEKRMGIAAQVAAYKREHALPVLDSAREAAVLEKNIARLNNEELRPFYKEYLTHLMGLSRQYQAQMLGRNTVAYQGVEGGFGHQVAVALYPHATLLAEPTFASVFEAVEAGRAAYGITPFENSTTGDVSGLLDLCYSHQCYIAAMYDLPVIQNLLGLPGAQLSCIKTVISHVQGLEQSKRFLSSIGANLQPSANTALAAKQVAEAKDLTVAAIASLDAAELYGLVPLAKDIADEESNTTRFIVLSKEEPSEGDHFSLLFTVENAVGKLAEAIQIIAAEGFDMESIKSRPIPKSPWQYYFYTEIVGSPTSREAKKLIAKLEGVCHSVRMLGIYYRLTQRDS